MFWKRKAFKSAGDQAGWIARNLHRFEITVLFVNNGWAVEYRYLRRVG